MRRTGPTCWWPPWADTDNSLSSNDENAGHFCAKNFSVENSQISFVKQKEIVFAIKSGLRQCSQNDTTLIVFDYFGTRCTLTGVNNLRAVSIYLKFDFANRLRVCVEFVLGYAPNNTYVRSARSLRAT